MWLAPLSVALIGAGLGVGLCSSALWQQSREERLDPKALNWFSVTAFVISLVIAYIVIGWGSLFGSPLVDLLGLELFGDVKHHQRHPSLLFVMWGCLAGSVELLIVATWLRIRRQART